MDDNILDQKWSAGSLLRFAFPTIVMMIFMGLYTIVDTIFVAQFVNTDALSSINIVCPIINVTVGLGTMIATGGNAIVSRKMGAGENQEAKEDFTLLIITGAVIGFAIFIIGTIWIDKIIYALGASDLLFPYCKDYLLTLLLFIPANGFANAVFKPIRNSRKTRAWLWPVCSGWRGEYHFGLHFHCPLRPGHPGRCFGDRLRLSDPHGCRAGLFCAEQRNAVFHKAKIEMGRDWGELFQWLLRNGEPTGNSRHDIPVQLHHDEPAGRKWRCGNYHYYLLSIPAEHTVYRLLYGNSTHYRV